MSIGENILFSVGDAGSSRRGVSSSSSNSLAPVNPPIKNVIHLACGWYHNIAYTNDNKWYGFGQNGYGELDRRHNSLPGVTELKHWNNIIPRWFSCGEYFSVIVDSAGKVFTCGKRKPQQLTHFSAITKEISFVDCGNYSFLALPTGTGIYFINKDNEVEYFCPEITFIDCGCSSSSSVALDISGNAYIWGSGPSCNETTIPSPQLITKIKSVNRVFGQSGGFYLYTNFRELFYAGSNYDGMAGLSGAINEITKIPQFTDEEIVSIVSSNGHTLILTEKGNIFTAGSQDYGLLMRRGNNRCFAKADIAPLTNVTCLASGLFHACLISNGPPQMVPMKLQKNFISKKLHIYE